MSLDLFNLHQQPIALDMPDADVLYYPKFIDKPQSDVLFKTLLETTTWKHDDITIFGKTYKQPRLTALYANNDNPYHYSNITMIPRPFTRDMLDLKEKIESVCPTQFTTCLLNLYRNGQDSNGWHADDEKELGVAPVIASLSLGEERWFHFKHKTQKELRKKILLQHGSLLLMKGKTQECWLHQIPKTKKEIQQRINLTFRVIK